MERSPAPSTSSSPGCGIHTPRSFSLLHPPGRRGAMVVPDTPSNTPTLTVATPEVTEVMETPDGLDCGVTGDVQGAGGLGHRTPGVPKGSSEQSGKATRSGGDMEHSGKSHVSFRGTGTRTMKAKHPGLFKLRRKSLVSLLESEYAQKDSESSDTAGDGMDSDSLSSKGGRQWSKVQSVLGGGGKGRRRASLANVILPFDLNDEDRLATKLSHVQREERSNTPTSDARRSTPRTPRLRITPQTPKTPSSAHRRLRSSRSPVTPKHNDTIYFTNEDVLTTPVNGRVVRLPNGLDVPLCSTLNDTPRRGEDREPIRSPALLSAVTTTPQRSVPSAVTPLGQRDKGDIRKKLQMAESPLVQQRKFDKEATQQLTKILTGEKDKKEDQREERQGKGNHNTSFINATPQRNPGEGGRVSERSASPCKDPGSVLKGVVAYVEVRVERDNRSAVIREQLQALGAQVESRLTRNTTHVIFREGSMSVFLRAKERGLHILSSLWVEACRVSLSRAPESQYPSTSIETYSSGLLLPKKRFRRQKSMQPREFSEEERRQAARVQRKYRKAAAAAAATTAESSTAAIPQGLMTPKHRVMKEDVNSPLFGIGHLLSPRHKDGDISTCPEEDEESETDDICTPLAQRLYRRYMSGQKDGKKQENQDRDEEEEGVVRRGGQETEEDRQTSGSSEALGTDGLKCSSEESFKLRLEGSDSSSQRRSMDGGDSAPTQPQSHESAPRRLIVVNSESDAQRPESNVESQTRFGKASVSDSRETDSPRLATSTPLKRKREEDEDTEPERKRGRGEGEGQRERKREEEDIEPERKRGRPGEQRERKREAPHTTQPHPTTSSDTPKRRQSMRLASRVLASPSYTDSPSKRHKNSPKRRYDVERNFIDGGRVEEKGGGPARSSTSSSRDSIKVIDGSRGTTTFAAKNNTAVDSGAASQNSPLLHLELLLTQGTCSQRGRRRLMCLDDDPVPSQELIQPTTPDHVEKRTGPYADILHPPPSKRRRNNHNAFVRKSPQVRSPRDKASGSANGRAQVRSPSLGDDSLFLVPKLDILPRPRRSTEEFKMGVGGRPLLKTTKDGKRRRRGSAPASLLCLTSVHSRDRQVILPIIRKLGGYKVGERVDDSTSHVVCGEQRRTLNLLLGIARGCWVLDISWVYRSLEGNAWAPEEPFELDAFAPAAKVCRQQRQAQGKEYQHNLFASVGRVCVLDGCTPPSAQLKELLELCGASLVSSVRSARLVVGSNVTPAIRSLKHSTLITHVSEKWVLDSIQHHRLHPVQDYLLS